MKIVQLYDNEILRKYHYEYYKCITQVLEDLVGGAEASTLEWTPLAGRRRNAAGLIKLGSSASE